MMNQKLNHEQQQLPMLTGHPLLGMMIPSPTMSSGLPDIDTSIFGIDVGGGVATTTAAAAATTTGAGVVGHPSLEALLGLPFAPSVFGTPAAATTPTLMRVNSIGAGSTFLSPALTAPSVAGPAVKVEPATTTTAATAGPAPVPQPLFTFDVAHQNQHQHQHQHQHPRIQQSVARTPESGATTGKPSAVLQPVQQQLQYGGDENTLKKPKPHSTKSRTSKKRGRTSSFSSGGGGGGAACAAGGVSGSSASGSSAGKKKKNKGCGGGGAQPKKQRRKIDTSGLADDVRRRLLRMFTKEDLRSEPEEWKGVHRPRATQLSSLEADFISELRRSELSCVYAERQRQRKLSKIRNADNEIQALRKENTRYAFENKQLRDEIQAMKTKYER